MYTFVTFPYICFLKSVYVNCSDVLVSYAFVCFHLFVSSLVEGRIHLMNEAGSFCDQALSVFKKVLEKLFDATICFGTLEILLDHRQQMFELIELIDTCSGGVKEVPNPIGEDQCKADVVQRCLDWRCAEQKTFELMHQQLQFLISFCSEKDGGKFRELYLSNHW